MLILTCSLDWYNQQIASHNLCDPCTSSSLVDGDVAHVGNIAAENLLKETEYTRWCIHGTIQ